GVVFCAHADNAAVAQPLGWISFARLSAFYPHGDVARKYGVFREQDGISDRAIFLVDKQGRIAWARTYQIPEQPDNAELIAAIHTIGEEKNTGARSAGL